MKIFKIAVVSLLAFMFIGCSANKETATLPTYKADNNLTKIEKLDKLILVSGMEKQVAMYPEMFAVGIEQGMPKDEVSKDVNKELIYYAKQSMDPKVIMENMRNDLQKVLTDKDLNKLLEFHYSEFNQKLARVHQQITPENYKVMMSQSKELLKDEERLKLAKEMDSLIGISDWTYKLAKKTGVSVVVALAMADHPNAKINMNKVNQIVDNLLKEEEDKIRQEILLSYLYTTQNLSINDIEKYIEWLKEPSARLYATESINSLDRSLTKSMEEMSKAWAFVYTRYKDTE